MDADVVPVTTVRLQDPKVLGAAQATLATVPPSVVTIRYVRRQPRDLLTLVDTEWGAFRISCANSGRRRPSPTRRVPAGSCGRGRLRMPMIGLTKPVRI
jgi:hypothetical protein